MYKWWPKFHQDMFPTGQLGSSWFSMGHLGVGRGHHVIRGPLWLHVEFSRWNLYFCHTGIGDLRQGGLVKKIESFLECRTGDFSRFERCYSCNWKLHQAVCFPKCWTVEETFTPTILFGGSEVFLGRWPSTFAHGGLGGDWEWLSLHYRRHQMS